MKNTSTVRRYHVWCLAVRLTVFALLVWYAVTDHAAFLQDLTVPRLFSPVTAAWGLLMLSMVLRLFPSREEGLGCQKLYARNFRPTGAVPSRQEIRTADRGAVRVALLWCAANVPFLLAYWAGWLSAAAMVCLAGFYGVCDIICILFYCPFQRWLMHQRCCTTCRIYDWDHLMLCTPLLVLPGLLPRTACLLAALLFLRWEVTYRRRQERFFESSNAALRCADCPDQLCRYKRLLAAKIASTPSSGLDPRTAPPLPQPKSTTSAHGLSHKEEPP